MQFASTRRRDRSGKGLLPPNPKQWGNEHNGLDLRDDLSLNHDSPLPHERAFDLLSDVAVMPLGALQFEAKYLDHLRSHSRVLSGACIPRSDGSILVIYNDVHPINRIRSTLMEEFFHLRLGHRPTTIRTFTDGGGVRTHDAAVENEAFGSGAAALVPYKHLRTLVDAGERIVTIANHFEVSTELVEFRAKVTKLYARLRRQ